MARRFSTTAEVRRRMDRLHALRNDPPAVRDLAREILPGEANPDLILLALQALSDGASFSDREVLRDLYAWLEQDFSRRDTTGTLRVEVLRVLWHLRSREDLDIAEAAARRREPSMTESDRVIRAAGLALLGVLDPEAAAYRAATILALGDAAQMSGEPALTAARLLGLLGHSVALTAHLLNSPPGEPPEVTAECLRGLSGLPLPWVQPVLDLYVESSNSIVLLGLADLVVSLEPGKAINSAVRGMLANAPTPEVYGFLATAVVASRRSDLLAAMLESLPAEMLHARLRLAQEALQFAPQTPDVSTAMAALKSRLAASPQSPDRARE